MSAKNKLMCRLVDTGDFVDRFRVEYYGKYRRVDYYCRLEDALADIRHNHAVMED